jgi:hypothetical protein
MPASRNVALKNGVHSEKRPVTISAEKSEFLQITTPKIPVHGLPVPETNASGPFRGLFIGFRCAPRGKGIARERTGSA